MIGRTVMPASFRSNSRKLIPLCALACGSVRTRQKIRFAYCACVVQILVPLIT